MVGMWQSILWADGYPSTSDIDCEFGSVTEATGGTTLPWTENGVGFSCNHANYCAPIR
ncbi:hypothetical protein GCM10009802_31570 [Streptomyces synnematoformans]|uniref:Uncharacterized protein n=1 Tax=Streptomyces synnematoformans TaxID=415721 RepID=A0ABN2YDR3_9ACTN